VISHDTAAKPSRARARLFSASVFILANATAVDHAAGHLGGQPLDWSTEQISGVVAEGSPIYFPSRIATLEGKKCLLGNMFNVNVREQTCR